MKKVLWISIAVVLILLAAAGGFYAGMTYQDNQVSQAQQRFFQARGQPPAGGDGFFRQGTPPADFSQGFRGGGVSGQVKSIEGNVLTLSTAEDVTMVNLADDTRILMNTSVSVDKLEPGTRVMVTGETGSDGEINAVQIMILDSSAPGGFGNEPNSSSGNGQP